MPRQGIAGLAIASFALLLAGCEPAAPAAQSTALTSPPAVAMRGAQWSLAARDWRSYANSFSADACKNYSRTWLNMASAPGQAADNPFTHVLVRHGVDADAIAQLSWTVNPPGEAQLDAALANVQDERALMADVFYALQARGGLEMFIQGMAGDILEVQQTPTTASIRLEGGRRIGMLLGSDGWKINGFER